VIFGNIGFACVAAEALTAEYLERKREVEQAEESSNAAREFLNRLEVELDELAERAAALNTRERVISSQLLGIEAEVRLEAVT
jgi:hypothetical protein